MRSILIALIGFMSHQIMAQTFDENIAFVNYLNVNRNYEQSLFLLNKMKSTTSSRTDSLNFFVGKTYYLDQQLQNASDFFDKVQDTSLPFWNESVFFNAFSKLNIEHYSEAEKLLKENSFESNLLKSLKDFELAGSHLLRRDFVTFDYISTNFSQNYFQFSQQEKSLISIREDLRNHKSKSPLLAGIFSAVVPGTGRIYAGKTGLGLGTLITSVIFGLQTWEGYRKDGVESARFIIFGSLFSIFYVGNIWGSVYTIKIANEEFNEAVNHKILVDLHIPLRTVFN